MALDSGTADGTGVTFRLADRPRRLAGVRLLQEIGVPDPLPFDRVGAQWHLRLDQPAVDRMEYLLEVTDHNGRSATIPDPGNPRRAPGAFGEKSVVEFAGYRPPRWLGAPRADGAVEVRSSDVLDTGMEVGVWSPGGIGVDEPAPMVAVHDGPEFAALAAFLDWAAAVVAAGDVPPFRVALLDPGDRNAWYSANDDYARALCEQVLPGLPPATAVVGVGASLGALAMLHAHHRHPGTFDALLLQSGSFFTAELDPQEAQFSGFADVTRFVESLHGADDDERPIPATFTCGEVEENLANNEAMMQSLRRLGYRAELHRRRDAHNFIAWRDALDPYLTDLLTAVVATRAT